MGRSERASSPGQVVHGPGPSSKRHFEVAARRDLLVPACMKRLELRTTQPHSNWQISGPEDS
jgi:hypothetical protein